MCKMIIDWLIVLNKREDTDPDPTEIILIREAQMLWFFGSGTLVVRQWRSGSVAAVVVCWRAIRLWSFYALRLLGSWAVGQLQ